MTTFEWTREDQIQAEAFRISRFSLYFAELLSPCFLHFSQDNILNIHASTPEDIDNLTDNLEELARYTWLFTGAIAVCLCFCGEEVLALPTQDPDRTGWDLLDVIQSEKDLFPTLEEPEMTAATLSAAKSPSPTAFDKTSQPSRPKLLTLSKVAGVMQMPLESVERLCEERAIELQTDEEDNPVIRLSDAGDLVASLAVATAIAKLTAPRITAEQNGGGTMVAEPPIEINGAQSKPALLPENFKVDLGSAKKTATDALALFASTAARQRQIAKAIANKTPDSAKYMKAIEPFYPTDRWGKACEQLRSVFKQLAMPPQKKASAPPAA